MKQDLCSHVASGREIIMDTADDNLEDLVSCALSPEREQELLDAQRECVFSWTNKKG